MTDFWDPQDRPDHELTLAGFRPSGGVQRTKDSGVRCWHLKGSDYSVEVAVEVVGGNDGAVDVTLTFDDDRRHPIGFIATGWCADHIKDTADRISRHRKKTDAERY